MRYLMITIAILTVSSLALYGQTPQIPTLQVCNATTARADATVAIASRAGTFSIGASVTCDPKSGYPAGSVRIATNLNDQPTAAMTFSSSHLDQVTSTGRVSPTAFISGQCTGQPAITGCRFWLLIADNRSATPDVASFLVVDSSGRRIAYGTGPLRNGDIVVGPTSN